MRLIPLLLAALILAGCAATSSTRWTTAAAPADTSACEREARAAGSLWMDASPLWRAMLGLKSTRELYEDCMASKGYTRT